MTEPNKPWTREDILAIPAGRELDALVMQHVMGWEKVDEGRSTEPLMDWYEYKDGVRYNVTHKAWTFHPSTNLSAAWEVANKYYYVDIRKMNKVDEDRRWKWIAYLGSGDGYSHNATADTAPEAICKASLLAAMGL